MNKDILRQTVAAIGQPGKGILAADESGPTIAKRFAAITLESTEENRRAYRELLFTTPGISEFISGVILFEETLYQKTKSGTLFPQLLTQAGIVPGIKVDKGAINLTNSPGNKITQGLDHLGERLQEYKNTGACFAKWRAVLPISATNPSCMAIRLNATFLARYAAICQENDIAPIVEPELLMDGDHDILRCEEMTRRVLHAVVEELHKQKVYLEGVILKPSMVISGSECKTQAAAAEIAERTVSVLRETIPAAITTINFLSGGQTEEEATENLNAMNRLAIARPWNLSFSYGRALQASCIKTWQGKKENVVSAQKAFLKRAKLNSAATLGQYSKEME